MQVNPPSLSPFTVLVTPSPIVVRQEADLVVVVIAPRGIYSSKSSQPYPLPPLPPRSAWRSTATVLLLVRLGWPLANPAEVFLRESAAGAVIVTVSGCSRHSFNARQTQNSAGKLLVSVYGSLVCFSFSPFLPSLCLSRLSVSPSICPPGLLRKKS